MPVYWFALGQVVDKDWPRAGLIFLILHFLVYPASNGYNSYMDRDQGPIGGLKDPLQPTRQLFQITLVMDIAALLLGLLIGPWFSAGTAVYILASRAYSYRGIRLKKYPILGWLTVISCQGALVFWLVYTGCYHTPISGLPWPAMIASSLLIGGFYPLTQIYQHEADKRDGVKTLSILLGYRGSFLFTAIIYTIAMILLAGYYLSTLQLIELEVLATCMLPVLVYFLIWAVRVWKDPGQANFTATMRMNLLASACLNLGFIIALWTSS